MPFPVSITVDDIEVGNLNIHRVGTTITFSSDYWPVDDQGQRIAGYDANLVSERSIPFANLPANIQQALQDIDTWRRQYARDDFEALYS